MDEKKRWKIVGAGVWVAGLTLAMLVHLKQSRLPFRR